MSSRNVAEQFLKGSAKLFTCSLRVESATTYLWTSGSLRALSSDRTIWLKARASFAIALMAAGAPRIAPTKVQNSLELVAASVTTAIMEADTESGSMDKIVRGNHQAN